MIILQNFWKNDSTETRGLCSTKENIYLAMQYFIFFFKFSGLGELCDTDLDELECEDGQWPRLFKGSACEDINDGDQFPNWKELENPCTDAVRLFINLHDLILC